MYIDKLDGKIGGEFFDRMALQWREEQSRCLRDIERHQGADQSYMDEGVQLLELARNAKRLFASRTRAKNDGYSISCYRTAPGEMAR